MSSFIIDPKYREILDRANSNNKNIFIPNSCLGHAIYASQLLLGRGDDKNPVKMFSGQLKGDFYDLAEIRQAFANSVEKNTKITIVAEKMGNRDFLEFAKKKKIEVRVLKETKDKQKLELGHFLLVGSAFRIEKPHTLEEYIAEGVVNFNNPKIASLLNQTFDFLVKNSKGADLHPNVQQ